MPVKVNNFCDSDEATGWWCPFQKNKKRRCRSAGCMAWRWYKMYSGGGGLGYCGLAGKPEDDEEPTR